MKSLVALMTFTFLTLSMLSLFVAGCSSGNNDLMFPAQPLIDFIMTGRPSVSVSSGHDIDLYSGDVFRPTAKKARRLSGVELIDISADIPYTLQVEDGNSPVLAVLETTADGDYRVRDNVPPTGWACRVLALPTVASPDWGISLVGINVNMPR